MLKALVGSFAAFLAALFLSAASASAQAQSRLAEQAHHHPDGLPGGLRRRRRRPHAAALAREVARPAPGHRLQAAAPAATSPRRSSPARQPDGYTFLLGTAATHGVNRRALSKLSFDVEADFTPISTLVDVPNVLAINPDVIDAKNVKDFIAKVKAAPGKYSYGSTGNGTGTHLAFAAFNAQGRPRHGARALQGRARRHQLAC